MGNFLDLLVFIGALYKMVVAAVVIAAVGCVLIAGFVIVASVVDWVF